MLLCIREFDFFLLNFGWPGKFIFYIFFPILAIPSNFFNSLLYAYLHYLPKPHRAQKKNFMVHILDNFLNSIEGGVRKRNICNANIIQRKHAFLSLEQRNNFYELKTLRTCQLSLPEREIIKWIIIMDVVLECVRWKMF